MDDSQGNPEDTWSEDSPPIGFFDGILLIFTAICFGIANFFIPLGTRK